MSPKISLFLLAASSLISAGVTAQEGTDIKYTYGEIRFVDVEIEDIDGDGFEVGGSYKVNEQFYVLGSYTDLDLDFSIDAEVLELGGGIIFPQHNVDLAAEVYYLRTEVNDDSESGWSLGLGGRMPIGHNLEALAFLRHTDVEESDTYIELGGEYFLQSNISLGLTLDVASEEDKVTFGGRLYF